MKERYGNDRLIVSDDDLQRVYTAALMRHQNTMQSCTWEADSIKTITCTDIDDVFHTHHAPSPTHLHHAKLLIKRQSRLGTLISSLTAARLELKAR